jgi:uncharacterized membrane protein
MALQGQEGDGPRQQESKPEGPGAHGVRAGEPPHPASVLARLRAYFLTGVIVTAPFSITIYLVWQFLSFLDTRVEGLLPARYNPETYLPFSLPGVGLVVMVAFLTLVGMLTAGLAGRTLVRLGERLLSRMPVVRSVYSTLKQIFETVLAQSSRSFREVVLIEYPRRGLGAIGFVMGPTRGEIQARSEEELVNVFLPSTPNPTSGFLLFVPKKDLIRLDMSVEDGIKIVISGGIVEPARQATIGAPAPGREAPAARKPRPDLQPPRPDLQPLPQPEREPQPETRPERTPVAAR